MSSIALFLILVIGVHLYFKKVFRYWKDRKVVSLPALPFVGSYGSMLFKKHHISKEIKKIYEQYPEQLFIGRFKGSKPELIVRDPDIIKMILVKDFNFFQDRSGYIDDKVALTRNLFNLKGSVWNSLRRKLTPTFTSSKMKLMFPLILECGEELQNYIKKLIQHDDVIEIKEVLAKYTTDTIGSCAFGLKMQSMADPNAPFRKIGKKIFEFSRVRVVLMFIRSVWPEVLRMLRLRISSTAGEVQNFFLGLTKEIISSRKNQPRRHDFMDLLIVLKSEKDLSANKDAKSDNNGDIQITDELIAAQAFVFFIAGFETSSTTMTNTLLELALNPRVQAKLLEEIDSVLKIHNGKLTYGSVQEMHYLEMVLCETLRKYPPLAFLSRQCNGNYRIPGTDVVIDENVEITIPVYALHHDPKYFPEPEKFIPERFCSDSEKLRHPFSYLPFGEGPRNCIGMRFGKLQSTIGMICFLRNYTVELCEKTSKTVEFDKHNTIITPKDGIWLRLKART